MKIKTKLCNFHDFSPLFNLNQNIQNSQASETMADSKEFNLLSLKKCKYLFELIFDVVFVFGILLVDITANNNNVH